MSAHEKKNALLPDAAAALEKLSPLERTLLPHLGESYEALQKKTALDDVSLMRALRFLEAKGVVKLTLHTSAIVDLGTNGVYYKKHHLPERALLLVLDEENRLQIEEAQKRAKLSNNEFKVSLGVLKGKAMLTITNGKLMLTASKEEIIKKMLEEQLLEVLPLRVEKLSDEQRHAWEQLKKRKDIVELREERSVTIELTALGKQIAGQKSESELIEEVTPEMIQTWSRGKRFRRYDLQTAVPHVHGGRRHFVNQAIEYGKRIWLDLGFQEMKGTLTESSFWVFDALFTPQDHPAREMQDTFFLADARSRLPEKALVQGVKKAHEKGVAGGKGWGISWQEKEAQRTLLRTHTTSVSARTLASLALKNLPAKYFIIGKVFRNETLDWAHSFEFYQSEGIVIDESVNFRHLLGYLQLFYKKMGFPTIRFRPSFFAYTEPSVEVEVFHPKKKLWLELGGAGIFRPEVVVPLLGKNVPVLAWGQGFDRIIMDACAIKDLREMYSNDIQLLREKKVMF